MKTKLIFSILILVVLIIAGIPFFFGMSQEKFDRPRQKIAGKNSVASNTTSPSNNITPYNHQETIRAIDGAWDSIVAGDLYSKNNQYDDAANAYEKAYSLDRGSRAVSGLLLAATYEKLEQYDNAVRLLDQMIKNGELSQNGIKNAKAIKTRILNRKPDAVPEGT